jgi:hypothetical protein
LTLLLEVGCRSPSASAPAFSQARPVVEFSIVTLNIVHGGKAALTVESRHLDYVSVEAQFLAAQNSCRLNKLVNQVLQKLLASAGVAGADMLCEMQ